MSTPPDRRTAILETAAAVFADQGYHEAGVADIAARLGMGHGTFYRYFRSKRDVLAAIVDDTLAPLAAAARRASRQATSLDAFEQRLEELASDVLTAFENRPAVARVLLVQAPAADSALRDAVARARREMAGQVRQLFFTGIRQGYLAAAGDPDVAARALVTLLLQGLVENFAEGRSATEARRRLTQSLRLVVHGTAHGRGRIP